MKSSKDSSVVSQQAIRRKHSSLPVGFEFNLPNTPDPPGDPYSHTPTIPQIAPPRIFSPGYDSAYDTALQPLVRSPYPPSATPGNLNEAAQYPQYPQFPNTVSLPHHRRSSSGAGLHSHERGQGNATISDSWSPSSSRDTGIGAHEVEEKKTGTRAKTKNGKTTKVKQKEEDEEPPAWSELKTKAGKERKRLPLACIACRRKKIRCSGEKPSCKHCIRSGIPCVYKVTTRKAAAPRTDYILLLENRMKRMEDRVLRAIPKDELADFSPAGRAVVKPLLPPTAPKPARSSHTKKRSADEAFVSELDKWTSSRGAARPTGEGPAKAAKGSEKTLSNEGAEFLPSKQLQLHLTEVYFDCLYGQSYLLLHKPTFMRKLKEGSVPPVLILAVCATAARFSTHSELNTEPAFLRGENWATPARDIVERHHSEPNITTLIAMLLLGLHYFGTCEGGLSWSFAGQCMRMAYALQLHRELDHDPLAQHNDAASTLSFTEREVRRRTMWASFLMDRFCSSGTERPPFGDENYLRIRLPIKESFFQMEIPGVTEELSPTEGCTVKADAQGLSESKDNMGVAAYVIRAVVLWGRIIQYLNLGGKERDKYPIWDPESEFTKLRQSVECLQASFPSSITYSKENLQSHAAERVSNQYLYLHIIVQHNILFLCRFAIPATPSARAPKDMPRKFLNDGLRSCVDAAGQISHLLVEAAGHHMTAPFAGYCAYIASTVHVWGIFSGDARLEAFSKENLKRSFKYLHQMKRYWGMFHFMVANVKEIYRQFADAASEDLPSDSKQERSTVWQYGDWFDKLPQGISGNSLEAIAEGKLANNSSEEQAPVSGTQSVEDFFASLSPPTKSEPMNPMARKHGKKSNHRDGAVSSQTAPARKTRPSKTRPKAMEGLKLPQEAHSVHTLPTDQPPSSSNQTYLTSPTSQTSSFNHVPQNFEFTSPTFYPTDTLPSLDRHLVFDGNAGADGLMSEIAPLHPSSAEYGAWAANDPFLNTTTFPTFPVGGGMDVENGMNQPQLFDPHLEPSSAWFLPFNMAPPQMGYQQAQSMFVPVASEQGLGDVGMADPHPRPETGRG